jgi:hypothetical protein
VALAHRDAELALELGARRHSLLHGVIEDDELAAARLLRARERDVRAAKEALRIARVGRETRDADRSGDRELVTVMVVGLADRMLYT